MRNSDFHSLIISAADKRFLSGDATTLQYFYDDLFAPITSYMDEESRKSFENAVKENSGAWFPVRIGRDEKKALFYLKVTEVSSDGFIRLIITRIENIVLSHLGQTRVLEAHEGMIGLCDGVFFDYDPDKLKVTFYNASASIYGEGVRPVDEMERSMTGAVTSEEAKEQVKRVFVHLRTKSAHFIETVDSNLINDSKSFRKTVVEGALITYSDGKEGIIGTIHFQKTSSSRQKIGTSLDPLTGLLNKADITEYAVELIDERRRSDTAIAIVDVDFFKKVNDSYGHQYGDEVLRRTAAVLRDTVGTDGKVGRIGGDEFLMILTNNTDEPSLRELFRTIRGNIGIQFPSIGGDSMNPLTLSIGCAVYPTDAENYDDLFMLADYCLYLAKYKGRNRYVVYTPEKHPALEEVRTQKEAGGLMSSGREVHPGDVIVSLVDRVMSERRPSPEDLLREFATGFALDEVTILCGDPIKQKLAAGEHQLTDMARKRLRDLYQKNINAEDSLSKNEFLVVNQIESLPASYSDSVKILREVEVLSFVVISFRDVEQKPCYLAFASVGKKVQWNQSHFKYYRVFTHLLEMYSF